MVNELLAKKQNLIQKKCLVVGADLLALDKIKWFQNVSLSQELIEMIGKPVTELSDSKCLCDLSFMVDITECLSELNLKPQGPKSPSQLSVLNSEIMKKHMMASVTQIDTQI